MKLEPVRAVVAAAVTLGAAALVAVSLGKSHPVYARDDKAPDAAVFTNLTERAMVIETTYSGVTRDEARLRYTWQPGEAGQPACPT